METEHEILGIDPDRLGPLREIVAYVRGIHHHIDPDQFDIEQAWLRTIERRLRSAGEIEPRIPVTYRDLLLLQITIEAAATLSNRRGFAPLEGVHEEDLDELIDWLSREATALFGRPPTIH